MCDKYDLNHSGTKALNIEGINFLEPFVSFHLWLEVSLIVSRSETETSLVICRKLHTCANWKLCHYSFLCSLIKSKLDKSSALDWMISPVKSAGAAEASTAPDMAPGRTSNCVLGLLCGSLLLVTAGKFSFEAFVKLLCTVTNKFKKEFFPIAWLIGRLQL